MNLGNTVTELDFGPYSQISPRYHAATESLWYAMHPSPRPCFNPQLLGEIAAFQNDVERLIGAQQVPIRYLVAHSTHPGVFNLGGDLELFRRHIEAGNRDGLLAYARACIDVLYANAVHLHQPLVTISLVQGSALGGGFEAAMSSTVLIAERGCEMGLPEILFNLFPGMGAFSLLARKLGMQQAEAMITAGRLFRAEELHEMGLVDVLAEAGAGEQAVADFIRNHRRAQNGRLAIQQVRDYLNPLRYDELLDIAQIWVDAALQLRPRDLRMMNKLVRAQNRLGSAAEAAPRLAVV